MARPGPRFITLEGGEGAGKSTQARRLAASLAAAGTPVLRTREPGGPPTAEAIRRLLLGTGGWDPVTELLLHFAARREHLSHTIRPALAAGITVVCDRFADSTLAYQHYGQGVARATFEAIAAATLDGLVPDLTLILEVDPAIGLARAAARGETNRYDAMDPAFHARLRGAFRAIAAAAPGRCRLIDASGPEDQVAAAVLAAVAGA